MYVWGMKTIIENNFMAWRKQNDVLNAKNKTEHIPSKELIADKRLHQVVK